MRLIDLENEILKEESLVKFVIDFVIPYRLATNFDYQVLRDAVEVWRRHERDKGTKIRNTIGLE